MTRSSLALASILIVLTMVGAALVAGTSVPTGTELPIHFGVDGTADRTTDKWTALLMPPGIAALVSALFYAIPALEPKGQGLSRSQGLYASTWVAMLLIFALIELAVISHAFGWGIPVNRLVAAGLGAALILIGNQLGKSRRMFLIGIRTPWTLASEEVWIKTHRLGGKMMAGAGLLMVAMALLRVPAEALAAVSLAAVLAAAIVPAVYSYLLWRQERAGGQPSE